MPAPNDLTPEEERMFVEHGVEPAGPGGEPIVEGQEEAGGAGQEEEISQQELNEQHEQRQEPKPGELGSRHRADGTFKTKEELDADAATLAAQQGQRQQGQLQGQQRQEEPKTVPLAALHEARQLAAQSRQREQLAMARLNALIAQQQQQGGQQAQQMPDLTQDPVGYIQAMEARLAAFEQSRAQENQYRQIDTALEQDEQFFSQTVPDYDVASDYYVQSRAQELLQFHTPEDAQRIMMQEARAIAQQSWARGQSPAQTIYGLAQARGYRPGFQPQGQQQSQGQQPQGQQQRRPNAQAQVDAVRKAQQASRSLSGGGGASNTDVLNAEALLAMSDEEFEQHLALGTKGANTRFAQALG